MGGGGEAVTQGQYSVWRSPPYILGLAEVSEGSQSST